ncbi:MAG: hypothetical protein BWY66_00498 [bacterium ADurb.Bin374]|nr:MAG: hypothetical protein BWY66_00498 [bacterium ADurb.Bin374]
MNKHLALFIIALVAVAISRHCFIEQYRQEAKTASATETMDEVRDRAGAYFSLEPNGASEGHHLEVHDEQPDLHFAAATGHEQCDEHASGTAHEDGEGHEHHAGHEHHGHDHAHDHAGHAHGIGDPTVSPGFVILLRQLGFAELAANLLWIQMDADSHAGLWHRVTYALELIPVLDPTFIDAFLLRAYLLDEYENRHAEAVQLLEKALKQNQHRMELWQQIGIYCLNHGGRHGPTRDLPKALDAFYKASNFAGAPPYMIRMAAATLAAMERRDEAVQLLRQVMSLPERTEDQLQIDRLMINRILSGEKF